MNPGATLSSGYTDQLARDAVRCDQARILARLRNGAGACCKPTQSNKSAMYASVLTQDKATACQPTAEEQLRFPKVGVPESVRIQQLQQATLVCSDNQFNPETRYSIYRRFVPQAPCPPPTATQLNSTNPKPSYIPGCDPGRTKFFY